MEIPTSLGSFLGIEDHYISLLCIFATAGAFIYTVVLFIFRILVYEVDWNWDSTSQSRILDSVKEILLSIFLLFSTFTHSHFIAPPSLYTEVIFKKYIQCSFLDNNNMNHVVPLHAHRYFLLFSPSIVTYLLSTYMKSMFEAKNTKSLI